MAEPDGVLGRAYGLTTGGMALIRPDGYIGLVADSTDERLLGRHVEQALQAGSRTAV